MIGATGTKMKGAAKALHTRDRNARQVAAARVAARRKRRETATEEKGTLKKKFAAFFEELRQAFAPGNICVTSDRAYEIHPEGSWRRRHDLIVKGGKVVGRSA